MDTYEKRRSFGDQFLGTVRRIVGPYILESSPPEVDQNQATDLMLMQGRTKSVAVRVRQHKYLERYPHDFTLRSKVRAGPSEVDKIMGGFGDLMFYGWANEQGEGLAAWMLLELNELRRAFMGCDWKSKYDTGTKPNGDGTGLRYFDVRSLPDDVVICRNRSVHQQGKTEAEPVI